MTNSCVFCSIVKGKIPSYKVFEDEKTLAFLDIHPSSLGHTLIIPKVHIARIEDLEKGDAEPLFRTLYLLVGGIQQALGAPASTIGINNGKESGQEIPHVHIHIIPRARGDRGGIIQGITRTINRPNQDQMNSIAKRIQESILDKITEKET
jgi:histidine triad (HIT) family protein